MKPKVQNGGQLKFPRSLRDRLGIDIRSRS